LLIGLNLSALSFLVFPLLGILVPLIVWVSKKDKIKNFNSIAKCILNFQITWVMVLFGWYILMFSSLFFKMKFMSFISGGTMLNGVILNLFITIFLYVFIILFVIVNTLRINNERDVKYFPKIEFLRK
jgi:uncharacterized Tic20 family protein